MQARRNSQSTARRKAARRLLKVIKHYNLDSRTISKETGIDLITVDGLHKSTPHLITIERISQFLEDETKKRKAIRDKLGEELIPFASETRKTLAVEKAARWKQRRAAANASYSEVTL